MKTTDVFRLYIWMIETFRRERALTLREFNDLRDEGIHQWLIETISIGSQAYFMDSFGVFVGSNFPVERHEDWSLFSLRLRPTLDFQQEILSRGADIEVLEPASLRDAMAERVRQLAGRYGL